MGMEWSIQQIAKLAGTSSRSLRHYDDLGLVPPTRVGTNGYRYYNEEALVQLQRVLLLRDLGLGLPQIGQILANQSNEHFALTTHLALLKQEQNRISRRINAVKHTIAALQGKELLMAKEMFDGFDHTQHKQEVEERWGKDAYARSDSWWRTMDETARQDWKTQTEQLGKDWTAAAQNPDLAPDSPEAQELAKRHVAWLTSIPGTPAADPNGDLAGYVRSLAEMYVADERFAANYGGVEGAEFVRDALLKYAD